MYCKNCGKTLDIGDKFCSNCGTKVETEFVPAFRQPADFTVEVPEEKKPKKNFQIEKFDWDLEGYPTDRKKTEDVNFSWDSVLEDNQKTIFTQDRIRKETETLGDMKNHEVPEFLRKKEEEVMDLSELEAALFADMGSTEAAGTEKTTKVAVKRDNQSEKIDKFYTFNKKNEEFQALLDQEYERIKSGGETEETSAFWGQPDVSSVNASRHEDFDWTLPGDRAFSEFVPAEETNITPLEYVGVVLSQAPRCYMAPEEAGKPQLDETKLEEAAFAQATIAEAMLKDAAEKAVEAAQKTKESEQSTEQADQFPPSGEETSEASRQTEEQTEAEESKLTFDDIFGDDDDDLDVKPKKKGRFLKVLAVILAILLVLELIMIGIQYFAPDSGASRAIARGYEYVIDLFSQEEDEVQSEPPAEETSLISQLIDAKADLGQNLAAVAENKELTFAADEDYGFEDFANTYIFADKPWYEENGISVTYGGEIIAAVIQYHSKWLDKINGKNEDVLGLIDETSDFYTDIELMEGEPDVEYGINKLEIGEIRAGSTGFYVLTSVAEVNSSTSKEKKIQQILYLEPINKSMKIVDVKEI